MPRSIQCPQCHSPSYRHIQGDQHQCNHCGSTFIIPHTPAPAPAPSPSQSYDGVVIPGEIDNGGKTPTQTISSNNFDKITVNGIDIT